MWLRDTREIYLIPARDVFLIKWKNDLKDSVLFKLHQNSTFWWTECILYWIRVILCKIVTHIHQRKSLIPVGHLFLLICKNDFKDTVNYYIYNKMHLFGGLNAYFTVPGYISVKLWLRDTRERDLIPAADVFLVEWKNNLKDSAFFKLY